MKQLHPRAVWLFFISSFLRVLLIFLIVGVQPFMIMSFDPNGNGDISTITILGLLFILIATIGLSYLWAKLCYQFYKYELTELGFRKESGVIRKKYVTIPYDRIQNVDIDRGILARLLGLSDLSIQTAGNSIGKAKSEGRLLGLSEKNAEELRDELIIRAKKSNTGGL